MENEWRDLIIDSCEPHQYKEIKSVGFLEPIEHPGRYLCGFKKELQARFGYTIYNISMRYISPLVMVDDAAGDELWLEKCCTWKPNSNTRKLWDYDVVKNRILCLAGKNLSDFDSYAKCPTYPFSAGTCSRNLDLNFVSNSTNAQQFYVQNGCLKSKSLGPQYVATLNPSTSKLSMQKKVAGTYNCTTKNTKIVAGVTKFISMPEVGKNLNFCYDGSLCLQNWGAKFTRLNEFEFIYV